LRRFGFGSSQIVVWRPNLRQRAAEFSGAVRGFFWAKVHRFGANGGDACWCRIPLEGVVVVILPALRLWVKTVDLAVSTAAALCIVALLRASPWSPDTTRYRFSVFVVLVFSVFLFFIFDLLYKRFSSPPCTGSAVGCYIIYSGVKACFEEEAHKSVDVASN
jgi:hypothetical protein